MPDGLSLAVVAGITGISMISVISSWLGRHAVDVEEGDPAPPFRFIVWGKVKSHRHTYCYRLIKLPCWHWQKASAYLDWRWHRGMLHWSSVNGWSLDWWPEI